MKNFDALPDSANVRQPVVKALFACSDATVWRRVKTGLIPKPQKHGSITAWNVGALRAALNEGGVK
ncbi:MAG: helix-turn-helix transcriptional regulator [Candidatus Methylumidiphilus sp.]